MGEHNGGEKFVVVYLKTGGFFRTWGRGEFHLCHMGSYCGIGEEKSKLGREQKTPRD